MFLLTQIGIRCLFSIPLQVSQPNGERKNGRSVCRWLCIVSEVRHVFLKTLHQNFPLVGLVLKYDNYPVPITCTIPFWNEFQRTTSSQFCLSLPLAVLELRSEVKSCLILSRGINSIVIPCSITTRMADPRVQEAFTPTRNCNNLFFTSRCQSAANLSPPEHSKCIKNEF